MTDSPFPVIETERLVLRQLLADDSDSWLRTLSDPEIARLIGIVPLGTVGEVEVLIAEFTDGFKEGTRIAWAITLREAGEFVGTCSYESIDSRTGRGEIGYDLVREYWGQGLMTEALRAIISYGFGELRLQWIQANTDPKNTASRNLLKKLKFHEEGVFRESPFFAGEHEDDIFYSLSRTAWYAT